MRREYNNVGVTISDHLRNKGYQTCEYIESHGTEYIDTEILYNSANEYTIYYRATHKNTYEGIGVFYGNGWDGGGASFLQYNHSNLFCEFSDGNGDFYGRIDTDEIFTVKQVIGIGSDGLTSTLFATNGVQYEFSRGHSSLATYAGDKGYSFFSVASQGKQLYAIKQALYEAQLLVNGTSARNLIPVYNISTGVGAMWDSISDTILTNQGSGSFTHGPNIEINEKI